MDVESRHPLVVRDGDNFAFLYVEEAPINVGQTNYLRILPFATEAEWEADDD
jgi:hypothetical protein